MPDLGEDPGAARRAAEHHGQGLAPAARAASAEAPGARGRVAPAPARVREAAPLPAWSSARTFATGGPAVSGPWSRDDHVLVVDDNEMNRDMLSRRLQRRGATA